jgi:hypothetical protein
MLLGGMDTHGDRVLRAFGASRGHLRVYPEALAAPGRARVREGFSAAGVQRGEADAALRGRACLPGYTTGGPASAGGGVSHTREHERAAEKSYPEVMRAAVGILYTRPPVGVSRIRP